jgi:hypothetical protein
MWVVESVGAERRNEMTTRALLTTLRDCISRVEHNLGRISLARCKKGAQRDYIAREFIKQFRGVNADAFDETLDEWMEADRPDPLSVQTLIQVMIETGNDRSIDTILDSIEIRIAGGLPPTDRYESEIERSIREAWWADCVLEPFEFAFKSQPRLRQRIKKLMKRAFKQSTLR